MLISGLGFEADTTRREPTCVVDVAPTILRHLGLSYSGLDGRPLQTT